MNAMNAGSSRRGVSLVMSCMVLHVHLARRTGVSPRRQIRQRKSLRLVHVVNAITLVTSLVNTLVCTRDVNIDKPVPCTRQSDWRGLEVDSTRSRCTSWWLRLQLFLSEMFTIFLATNSGIAFSSETLQRLQQSIIQCQL